MTAEEQQQPEQPVAEENQAQSNQEEIPRNTQDSFNYHYNKLYNKNPESQQSPNKPRQKETSTLESIFNNLLPESEYRSSEPTQQENQEVSQNQAAQSNNNNEDIKASMESTTSIKNVKHEGGADKPNADEEEENKEFQAPTNKGPSAKGVREKIEDEGNNNRPNDSSRFTSSL